MGLATWNTNLVSDIVGEGERHQLIFFFVASICLLALMYLVGFFIPDMSPHTQESIERQLECEKFLLMGIVKDIARAETRRQLDAHKKKQMNAEEEKWGAPDLEEEEVE